MSSSIILKVVFTHPCAFFTLSRLHGGGFGANSVADFEFTDDPVIVRDKDKEIEEVLECNVVGNFSLGGMSVDAGRCTDVEGGGSRLAAFFDLSESFCPLTADKPPLMAACKASLTLVRVRRCLTVNWGGGGGSFGRYVGVRFWRSEGGVSRSRENERGISNTVGEGRHEDEEENSR